MAFSTGGFISGNQTSNRYHESSKVAFFIGDEIKGEKFNFDLGLRWERTEGIISRETGVGSNNFQKGHVATDGLAISLAGLYKANNSINLYGNFSRGYFFPELRSVSFSAPGEPQSYEPEIIYQAEAGFKYGYKKVAATAAIFYVSLNDRRSVDFINDPNNPGELIEQVRVQDTRTIGIETTLNYAISKEFSLFGNFTYQDHEFTKVEGNPEQEGNELRRQPNVLGMVGFDFEKSGFDASFSVNFMGNKFANDANTVELDGFNIARLDAGYKFPIGNTQGVRLGVSVFNLFDSEGITEGSPRQGDSQTGTSNYFVGRPILPRRVFLRASFDF